MNAVSKKWIASIVAVVLAASLLALAGCSCSTSGSSAGSGSGEESSATQIANPWSDAASAEEAAKGAGLDTFALPEGEIADMGKPIEVTYRYMEGMAEARYEFPASAVTVRTAAVSGDNSFDITGDYNTYAKEWTEIIGDISVACAGNRDGESMKTYWGGNGFAHSIVTEGLGGDDDFGLTAERLAVFVETMK